MPRGDPEIDDDYLRFDIKTVKSTVIIVSRPVQSKRSGPILDLSSIVHSHNYMQVTANVGGRAC